MTAHPGPATSPPPRPRRVEQFARLDLTVRRKVEGRLHGEHQGLLPGQGSELGEARRYEPGDDVRMIDWAVTARTRRPHVRDTVADHELKVVVLLDLSASMDFGTALATKREVALTAVGALGFLVAHGANSYGVLALHPDGEHWTPPRQGRAHVYALLHRIDRLPSIPGSVDLGLGLARLGRVARRAGLVAVVSDFLSGGWERPLRAIGQRHDLLAVQVTDPRERQLPDVGYLTVQDPETGRRRVVDTADPLLRARYADLAARRQERIAEAIRRAGGDHLVLSTDRDWVRAMIRHVETRRRTRHLVRR